MARGMAHSRGDHVDSGIEGAVHLGADLLRPLRIQRDGVVDVANELDAAVDGVHCLLRIVLGVEVEGGHIALGDGCHPVDGLAADVEDQGYLQALGHLLVNFQQESVIVRAADEVAGRVVGEGEGVGPGVDLGLSEEDRYLLELVKRL